MPAHNRMLRRKLDAGIVRLVDGLPQFVCAHGVEAAALSEAYGPFGSRTAFRATLRTLAREYRLCWRRLALERRSCGPCFARQLGRCDGVCVDEETPEAHDRRLADALAPFRIPKWPFPGAALVRECASASDRVDVHVVRDWCWLGTAHDDGELGALLEAPQRPSFDPDVTRLILARYRSGALRFLPIPHTCAAASSEGRL